jgi:hypothetical protein
MSTDIRTNGEEGLVEERLSVGFVIRGPTAEIHEVSTAIKRLLDSHPKILAVYRKGSHGRLWIREGDSKDG